MLRTVCVALCALLLVAALHFAVGADDPALRHLEHHHKQYTQELLDLVAIPSVSSLPEHAGDVANAADWMKRRLQKAGLEDVQVLPTGAQPVVFGQWLHAPGAPTVLVYGHYDVQPVDPLELWETPPFEPVLKDGEFRGRGVDDDKGGLLQPIQAVEALLAADGRLPVNIKFLLEGQEEIGSPHLAPFLTKHADVLKADYALSADGGQISEAQGGIPIGLRGAVAVEVDIQTAAGDLHSGMKGGSVRNALHVLAALLAGLHTPDGRVTVPGFYDAVRPATAEDRADLAAFPFDEARELASLGASEAFGEAGYSTLERRWLRPTLEVVGAGGGFQGAGVKTIVPARARAKLSARLVPDQDPDHILAALQQHVEGAMPLGANITFRRLGFHAAPYLMPRDTPVNRAAAQVLEEVMGARALYYRDGGTIPALALFQRQLGLQMTSFGFGLPDDRIHAPNERYRASMYDKGRVAYVKLLRLLGAGNSSSPKRPRATAQDEL